MQNLVLHAFAATLHGAHMLDDLILPYRTHRCDGSAPRRREDDSCELREILSSTAPVSDETMHAGHMHHMQHAYLRTARPSPPQVRVPTPLAFWTSLMRGTCISECQQNLSGKRCASAAPGMATRLFRVCLLLTKKVESTDPNWN